MSSSQTRDFAAEVRRRRGLLQGSVKRGEADLQRVIRETPSWMRNVRVLDALIWVPGHGSIGAERMLKRLGIDPWAEIGRLNVIERLALCAELDDLEARAA